MTQTKQWFKSGNSLKDEIIGAIGYLIENNTQTELNKHKKKQ